MNVIFKHKYAQLIYIRFLKDLLKLHNWIGVWFYLVNLYEIFYFNFYYYDVSWKFKIDFVDSL